jgi:hypothetical protein
MKEKDNSKQPRIHDLFTWQSLSRPSFDYPKGTLALLGSIVVFLTVLFILFQEWLAIAVSWAAYFLFFALTKVPQTMVGHKITTEGIVSIEHSYLWQELGPFWFKTKNNERILHVASKNFFWHLIMLINPADEDKIRETLAEYLPYIEVPEKTTTEKVSEWFEQKFLLKK